MVEYQPWRAVVEGIDGALICVIYRNNERREKGEKETGIVTAVLWQRLLEPKYR